ncbi:MAG: hypothetical protein WBM02_10845 [bacterium]
MVYHDYKFLYVGSVKGIQEYIFRVSKLKYIIGATELIEDLREELKTLLKKLGFKEQDYYIIQLAGGNARILFKEKDKALQFMEIWPLLVRQYAPGIKYVQALAERKDNSFKATIDKVEQEIRANRNINYPDLPPAEPIVGRHRRTGLPLGSVLYKTGSQDEEELYPDRETLKKLQKTDHGREALAERIGLNDRWSDKTWTREFDKIAPKPGQYMAVIHADANKLGKTIADALGHIQKTRSDDAAIEFSKKLTDIIENVTQESLKTALAPIVDSCESKEIPARVIVCAGDDMTIVLPAENAIEFTVKYLNTFQAEFSEKIKDIAAENNIHLELTASAGIAFVKSSYPFAQAYQLCEEMCSFTKKQLERNHAGLAFHRITTSGVRKYDDIIATQLTIQQSRGDSESRIVLNMMPYTIDEVSVDGFPSVSKLLALVDALGKMSRGSIRELISATYRGKAEVDKAFNRILQVAENRKQKKQELKAFQEALKSFKTEDAPEGLMWSKANQSAELDGVVSYVYTPLMDALELMAVNSGKKKEN